MSDEFQDLSDWRAALNHPAMVVALRIAKTVARGLILFAVCFTEIVSLLLAPIVLICGIGWMALPHLLRMAETESQSRELVSSLVNAVPGEIRFGGTTLTPTSLIFYGFMLIAVAALCRTFETIVSTEN